MFESSIMKNSTIQVLDNYIESKEQYFFITDSVGIKNNEEVYNVNFIISNKIEQGKKIVPTNITMTEFKKIYKPVFLNCEKILNYHNHLTSESRAGIPQYSLPVFDFIGIFYNHFKDNFDIIKKSKNNDIIFFDNPISINAQSSKNRTGFGWIWEWEYGNGSCIEGTFYGETSQFPIVGYVVKKYGDIIKREKEYRLAWHKDNDYYEREITDLM